MHIICLHSEAWCLGKRSTLHGCLWMAGIDGISKFCNCIGDSADGLDEKKKKKKTLHHMADTLLPHNSSCLDIFVLSRTGNASFNIAKAESCSVNLYRFLCRHLLQSRELSPRETGRTLG